MPSPTKKQQKRYNKKNREYKKLWQQKQRENPEYRKYEKLKANRKYIKKIKNEGNSKWKALKD